MKLQYGYPRATFLGFFLGLLLLPIPANALGNETDRLALLKFKESITNDPLEILSWWNDSISFCNWPGVTCGRRHHRVTALNLEGHNLKGLMSPYIGNLTFLRFINLMNNSLSGEIPREVGRLFRLQHLSLTNNTIGGRIPVSLRNCSKLKFIDLFGNRLTGNIPKEIGSLTKLEVFQVRTNNLIGEIPISLGNLSSLRFFSVEENNLVGNIPAEIGRLTNLHFFSVGINYLSGPIPSSLYNLSSMVSFSLLVNQFHGTLPSNLGLAFPNLQELYIGQNEFSGNIPVSLPNASRLLVLDLPINKFTGQIPANLGNLVDIWSLNFDENSLGGNSSNDWSFLKSLANCSKLKSLDLSLNNFGGALSDSLGNLTSQLEELDLGGNYISGNIPSTLENLINLNVLGMEYNLLTGIIPQFFGKFRNMHILTLGANRLSGKIPASIGNITQLITLDLGDNQLEGTIPSSIGNLKYLQFLSLSINNLSGEIPMQVFSLPSLSLMLDLSINFLSGSLSVEVGKLKNVNTLNLSSNNLSGEIPSAIGDCSSLEGLFLQGNSFDGIIPSSLASVKGLVELDLSLNNLSGQIPKDLQNLHVLSYLNVSFNHLAGEVPTKGVFGNASAIYMNNNSKLCGGVQDLRLPSCPVKATKKKKKPILELTMIAVCVVAGLFLFPFLFALSRRKKIGMKSSATLSRIELLPKVSYRALLEATSSFSPENLIGSGSFGSVYKGILNEEEKTVAVKVLNLQKKGATKSFMAECKALRNIRHRNLVSILTSCSSIDYNGNDFKALVFEFMENGNLEKWLHKGNEDDNQSRSLSLLQRLNIVLDVANGLHYLHDQCEEPIIHCDLKPSNVLLDKDMIAHVSDFGLAKLLSTNAEKESSTVGLMGSIGYTAPEYGMGGKASKLGDVYSFGILVLEIFTARRPTNQMFNDNYNLHNFVQTAIPYKLLEIVDPNLPSEEAEETISGGGINSNIVESHHEIIGSHILPCMNDKAKDCLLSVLEIGIACSREIPNERANLNDVIKQLHLMKNAFLTNFKEYRVIRT